MKIHQKKDGFRPITITLNTRREARNFISVIDKVDSAFCNANLAPRVNSDEYESVIKPISDAFTDLRVSID